MLNMDTKAKHYVKLVRKTLSNDIGSLYTLEGTVSQAFSNNISYSKRAFVINEEDIKTVDRDIYDIFEYETVEVNLLSYCWEAVVNACYQNRAGAIDDFVKCANIYLARNNYPEVLNFYNTKRFGLSTSSFSNERNKRKHFKTFAILKDSLKYVPTEKYSECALKNDYKLKIFNTMYAESLENDLKFVGLNKYAFADLATLSDGGNAITLSLKVEEKFRSELLRTLTKLKEEILDEMFDGKFREILNANRLSADTIFETITRKFNEDCCGSFEFEIPTKDIL